MILYLSSYKFGNDTQYLKDWISKNNNEVLLIFNALDAKGEEKIKNNISIDTKLLTEIGFEVKVVDLKDYFGKAEQLKNEFSKYNTYCVMGGNVFVLRQAMNLSGFDEYLKEISSNDNYLYIGYSAGSCVLSKDIEPLATVDEPISLYDKSKVIYEGIGLVNYLIIPHYKSDYHKSYLIDELVLKCEKENIKFKTINDGDVKIIWK